jgi:peroxiredoxin
MARKSRIAFLTILGVVVLTIALYLGLFETSGSRPKKFECVGEERGAPRFTLLNLKGEKVDSADFRGKVILLNFWATWCSPCRQEIPSLNDLYRQYNKEGLAVIGISLDRGGVGEVQRFVDKFRVEYINVLADDAVVQAFSGIPGIGPIQVIPVTFIIDRKGQICRRFVGFTDKRVFEEAIRQVLSEGT